MSLNLKIITPQKVEVDVTTTEVMLGGYEGYFTIFTDHTPFLSRLKISTGYYVDGDKLHAFSIKGGFCSVENNEVVVITSTYVEDNIKKRSEAYDKTIALTNMDKEEVGKYFEHV